MQNKVTLQQHKSSPYSWACDLTLRKVTLQQHKSSPYSWACVEQGDTTAAQEQSIQLGL
jgi:hypothetical protein